MPSSTKQMKSQDASYQKAWSESPKKFEACAKCPSPGYCKANGCQSKEAAKLKKLGG
jgi:hypothetical protein